MSKAAPSPLPQLSLWMSMLLVWNIALLCIAIFFLFKITQHPLSSEEIAAACLAHIPSQP